MARSLLTYEGALALLGKHDHPLLDKVNTLLGGALVVGGAVTGTASWALIEPKNELIDVMRSALDNAKNRMLRTSGYERRELLTAAHTVLAISAFFQGVADVLGPAYKLLKLTDEEKLALAGGKPFGSDCLIESLRSTEIELPSIEMESDWPRMAFYQLSTATVQFINGLAAAQRLWATTNEASTLKIVSEAITRYYDARLRFAVDVPEFALLLSWSADEATRSALRNITAVLTVQSTSLSTMHDLLALTANGEQPARRSERELLATRAAAVLAKPLLRFNPHENTANVAFPTVEQGFVTPRYRIARYVEESAPASDNWWDAQPVMSRLDEFLAAYLVTDDSTQRPLLILGDPGAGKSLLTEVLAARLPSAAFTVFRVELRDVGADKKIYQQIGEAMGDALDRDDVQWGQLTEQCHGTVRVVILDGFDELVLATGVTRSTYLEEIVEFQRKELDLKRPVAVIVTSRTLVADRARIPVDSVMIKLEEFDDGQIQTWLRAWNTANANTTGFRALSIGEVLAHRDLACQPLLLLILAIYAAGPGAARLDSQELSHARLYRRLLDTFIRRQVDKSTESLTRQRINAEMINRRWQLGITAFGMFNRGLQHITEAQLESDLTAFAPTATARERTSFDEQLSEAEQTISSFFFIQDSSATQGQNRRQTYEFLHSTFAEYLIAERTMDLLSRLADQYAATDDGFPMHEPPDDDRVFALLSHQALVKRKPIIDFATAIHADYDENRRDKLKTLLIELLRRAQTSQTQRKYERYDPTPYHVVTRIANYTANLATLVILLGHGPLSPADLAPDAANAVSWWRSLVNLWDSGLDGEGWSSILESFTLSVDQPRVFTTTITAHAGAREALLGQRFRQVRLEAGTIMLGDGHIDTASEFEIHLELASTIRNKSATASLRRLLPHDETSFMNIAGMLADGARLSVSARNSLSLELARSAHQLPFAVVSDLVTLLLTRPAMGGSTFVNECDLAVMVAAHPRLLVANDAVVGRLAVPDFPSAIGDGGLAVVALWRAEQNATEPELSALLAFRLRFDQVLARVMDDLSIFSLPPEFFTYLRLERPAYWRIGLLVSMVPPQHMNKIAPVDALHLATTYFDDAERDPGVWGDFVRAYLGAHEQSADGDLVSLMVRLRVYAEQPWERP